MELLEFYPTPDTLLEKILSGIKWYKVKTILEPSAGKGNIVRFIKENAIYKGYECKIDFDCIEKDENLQKVLIGNNYRLVHDDFLTFNTFKCYDMIVMNPPFLNGDKHLTKALDMQEKTGGDVICILNAETLRNPYSNLRKALIQRLNDAGAIIEFMHEEFSNAERTTDVEIAVVKVHYNAPETSSRFIEELEQKSYGECDYLGSITDLAPNDPLLLAVKSYQIELEAGINLIKEYKAIAPRLMPNLNEEENKYKGPMLELKCNGFDLSINDYVQHVRMKYWRAFFADPKITGTMTSNLKNAYAKKVEILKDYDFSLYNIKTIQVEMRKNLTGGIEQCIIDLFDKFTVAHSWYPECEKNIHYFNGWSTNKAWIINKKVIIPLKAFDRYDKFEPAYHVKEELGNIEKALNYLDGGLTDAIDLEEKLTKAKEEGQTKDIDLKYFTVTFYKKGTCHLIWKDEKLLKKFNIFGSQGKGFLPPSYGKKNYSDMTEKEKTVINEFEGEASYRKVMNDSRYYLFDVSKNVMLLEGKAS